MSVEQTVQNELALKCNALLQSLILRMSNSYAFLENSNTTKNFLLQA